MKHTITRSYIQVIGKTWMPAITCAMEYSIDSYAINNMRDDNNKITKDTIEHWLMLHSGDFQSIDDFHADIEPPEGNIIVPWASEESELIYCDCMYPQQD